MECQFSETQFQSAIVSELMQTKTTIKKMWKPPIMPNTVEESRLGGYDCEIEGPVKTLFFQFKLSRKLTRSYANHWDLYNPNVGDKNHYYEFDIRPLDESTQHNDLIGLAKSDPRCRVFYCAPGFIKNAEYQDFYVKQEIVENSIFVPCKPLPIIKEGEKHSVTFVVKPRRRAKMHSKVYDITSYNKKEFLAEIEATESFKSLEDCLNKVSKALKMDRNPNKTSIKQLEEIQTELFIKKDIQMIVYQ